MTPMADLSSLGPRHDADMGVSAGWQARGRYLEYGVSVLPRGPSESRSAWIPATDGACGIPCHHGFYLPTCGRTQRRV